MLSRKISGFLLLFLFFVTKLHAQKLLEESLEAGSSYTVQYWKTEDGLPQNTVLSVNQSTNGSIWLISYAGVSSFDGQQFVTYNESNVPAFKGQQLSNVATDANGGLLVNSANGSYLFNKSKRTFTLRTVNGEKVLADAADSKGNRWIATAGKGLYLQSGSTQPVLLTRLPSPATSVLVQMDKLLITTDLGLYIYDNSKLIRVDIGKETSGSCSFFVRQSIYPHTNVYDNRRIPTLLSIQKEQVCFYKTCDSKHIYTYNLSSGVVSQSTIDIGNATIQSLYYDAKNFQTWIATDKGLYFKKGKAEGKFERIPFLNDECYSVFQDIEDNIWVGTKSGLYLLKPKIFHTYSQAEGLTPDGIAAVLEVKPGELLIANSACGGLFSLKNGVIKKSPFPELRNMCAWSLFKDSKGDVLVGGAYGLLYRISNGKCTQIVLPPACRDASVLCMYEDAQHCLWIGTGAGLFILDSTGKVSLYSAFHSKGEVLQLFQDTQKRLWLGTTNQLAVLENGNWKDLSRESGLKVSYIRSFYEDIQGNIWIGTRGEGLLRYSEGKFLRYPEIQNMFDRDVWSITEDKAGYLWMSSNHGITAANREDLINLSEGRSAFVMVKHFDRTDGMLSTEFNGGSMPACLRSSDGRLWFPGVKGLTVVDPATVNFSALSVPITLEKIVIDGKEFILDEDSIISTHMNPGRIEVFYSSPVFGHKADLFFQTGIDGYDASWHDPSQRRSVVYENLPAGSHNFRVKHYGNYNKDINREESIKLVIPEPWYQNTLLITLLAVVILLLAIGIAIWRIKWIRRQTEQRQKLEKQFTALELKALQSQMNPHFIFNCLNSIKYFISVHDEESAGKYLQSFSRLLRKFLEHSDSQIVSLAEEIELLKLYMDLQQMRFTHKFHYEVLTNQIKDQRSIQIPTMLLQPYVENAIIHGLMPLDSEGKLTLSLTLADDQLKVIIRDEGIGRANAATRNKSHSKSMGISITEGRIDLLNYFNGYQITSETADTFTDGRVNTGTTVSITIPVTYTNTNA